MREKELIAAVQSHLDSKLSVPVKQNTEDRDVPLILIEDWNTEELNPHNSAYTGEQRSTASQDYERYLTFDFKTRIEFAIRHNEPVDASLLKDKLVHELRLIGENPLDFDDELKRCDLGSSGEPSSEFVEPRDHELMVSATFHGDEVVVLKAGDTASEAIQEVLHDFSFN